MTTTITTDNGHRSVTPPSGYRMTGWRLDLLLWLADHGPIAKKGTYRDGTVYAQILRRTTCLSSHINPSAALGRALHAYEDQGFVILRTGARSGRITAVRMTEEGRTYVEARRKERNELRPQYLDATPSPEPVEAKGEGTDPSMPADPFEGSDSVAITIATLIREEAESMASGMASGSDQILGNIRTILHSGGSPLSMLAQIEALL